MTDFTNIKLSEIAEIKYGKDHKKLKDGTIPVYGSGGIMRYVDTFLYDNESVLIPRKGTLSNVFYCSEPFWTVDTIFWTKINDELVIPKYFYYYINQLNLESLNVGTAVPSLTTKVLNEVEIPLPPLPTQRRIAAILSSLDDKIENNRKTAEKLEEIAQTLFKRWFVDFEFPCKDGKPYKTSGGEMVYCDELGKEIPLGWTNGTLDDIGTIVGGSTPSKKKEEYYTDGIIPWITPRDLSNHDGVFISHGESFITEEGYSSCSTKLLPKNSILFSSRAPIGYIAIASNPVCTNQGFKSIDVNKGYGTEFVYQLLKYLTPSIINSASGSTFKEISTTGMKSILIAIPSADLVKKYCDLLKSAYLTIKTKENEITMLIGIRDALLPKLMSGDLSVEVSDATTV